MSEKRLSAVASLVREGGVAADIGCDHALLGIRLIREGRCRRVIACDLRPGPLSRAAENISSFGLSDSVELRLGDGLAPLAPCEADALILSGIGGPLIVRILSEGLPVARSAREIILSPQSRTDEVRLFLAHEGFRFVEETVVEEGHFYPLMRVRYAGGEAVPALTQDAAFWGVLLPEDGGEETTWYYRAEFDRLCGILSGLRRVQEGTSEDTSGRKWVGSANALAADISDTVVLTEDGSDQKGRKRVRARYQEISERLLGMPESVERRLTGRQKKTLSGLRGRLTTEEAAILV